MLKSLRDTNKEFGAVIDLLCIGKDRFIKYWEFDPNLEGLHIYEKWHSYTIQ